MRQNFGITPFSLKVIDERMGHCINGTLHRTHFNAILWTFAEVTYFFGGTKMEMPDSYFTFSRINVTYCIRSWKLSGRVERRLSGRTINHLLKKLSNNN